MVDKKGIVSLFGVSSVVKTIMMCVKRYIFKGENFYEKN